MSKPPNIKLNLHYGGLSDYKDGIFKYSGGVLSKDIEIDPDYMCWMMFEKICIAEKFNGGVEQVWYKLPQEELGSARPICFNKDLEIRQMCAEAMLVGEVDLYIEHCVSDPVEVPLLMWKPTEENVGDEEIGEIDEEPVEDEVVGVNASEEEVDEEDAGEEKVDEEDAGEEEVDEEDAAEDEVDEEEAAEEEVDEMLVEEPIIEEVVADAAFEKRPRYIGIGRK